MPNANWRWVPSEKAFTKLGYLTAILCDGRIIVDIYGSSPLEKDNEPLCREIARKLDAHDDLLAACRLWDEGFTEGEQFTPEQLLEWMNKNRRAARAAIAKAMGT